MAEGVGLVELSGNDLVETKEHIQLYIVTVK